MDTLSKKTSFKRGLSVLAISYSALLISGCSSGGGDDDTTATLPVPVEPQTIEGPSAPTPPAAPPAADLPPAAPPTVELPPAAPPAVELPPAAPPTTDFPPAAPLDDTPPSSPTGPGTSPVSSTGGSAEAIARLTPSTQFVYTFAGGGDPVVVTVPFSASDIETVDGESDILSLPPNGNVVLCNFVDGDTLYFCINLSPAGDALLTAFTLEPNNQGFGIFEFCTPDVEPAACADDFANTPDGTVDVSASLQIAEVTFTNDYLRYDGGAYFNYIEQGLIGDGMVRTDDMDISVEKLVELIGSVRNR